MKNTEKENNRGESPAIENNSSLAHLIRTKRLSSASKLTLKCGAFASLFPAIGLIIVLSYFYLFWLIAVIGLVTLSTLWRFKDDDTYLSALCFVSVFVSLYGLLGVLVQLA